MKGKRTAKTIRLFLPWFLDLSTLRKLESILPHYYHMRLRLYFNKYGCIRCNRKRVLYCANGMCKACNGLVNDRLRQSDKTMKRRYGKRPELPAVAILKRMATAQELLKDFRNTQRTSKLP